MDGLLRTHYCTGLQEDDIGKKATVTGWVQRTRDMGGIIFLDLRDKTGILQVVFDLKDIGEEMFLSAEALRNEYVVKVDGEVRERDEETYNPNIPTGTIELRAESLEILSKSKVLPFPIEDYINVNEELRLKYRYLDLRRPHLLDNLALRHKTTKAVRNYLDDNEFLEVETPILTKSTPEGARDYLVPSRIEQGKFYALPQSPQIFKQLLMVGNVDRYYQIARCFRDEDLRADRQPEFTQVDIEMSFVTQEAILNYLEGLFKNIFSQVMALDIKEKFPRMTYQEAMDLYGTDKPDLRFGMEIIDLTDIAKKCDFKVFRNVVDKGGAVRALNIKGGNSFSRNEIDELTDKARSYGAKGMAWIAIEPDGNLRTLLTKFLSKSDVEEIIKTCKSQPGDLIIFCADKLPVVYKTLGNLRLDIGTRLGLRKKDDYKFLIVTDFPLLEWSEEENRYIAMHHPFTMPADIDRFMNNEDIANMNANSYDFVLNGIELGSGSIRIHRSDIQQKMFEVLGFDDKEIKERFGFMIEAFSYGTPPHGGFAFGLDRLIMLMAKADSIRDVIAFPKMRDATCAMTEAPSTVAKDQLDILGISISQDGVSERKIEEINDIGFTKFEIDDLLESSQLRLEDKEKEGLEKDLIELIKSTSIIKSVDTDDTDPLINIYPINNVTRADLVEDSLKVEEVLYNAPSKEGSYILVPKISE
ncbi:MAG TPA: aspartate--tRNA ligase [Tissierellaceae bacterium]|nr:aspartate--tRNA ligase [Tissierellaceae bacterium]